MCRSPLPNRSQPSARRWRVGRNPTARNFAFTSCQGQPVSAARAVGGCRPGPAAGMEAVDLKIIGRDGVIGNLEAVVTTLMEIVAFVTCGPADANPSRP